MIYGLAAGPDPQTMSCEEIIRGYEKNKLLASPEGGRSKNHRKNHAVRVQELEPFYGACVTGDTGTTAEEQIQMQAVVEQIYGSGGAPSGVSPGGPVALSTQFAAPTGVVPSRTMMWVALGVGGALLLTWFLTRKG